LIQGDKIQGTEGRSMNILIIGGSGFIGRHLTQALLIQKRNVAILSRGKPMPAAANYEVLRWKGTDLANVLGNRKFDAVVNLAGETIGKWPWSAEHKRRVLQSRQDVSRLITTHLAKQGFGGVYIQASGIGYYGDSHLQRIDETGPKGNDFLAEVSDLWESAAEPLISTHLARVCFARTGLVLAENEGALPLMALPVKLFAGGKLGDGGQGVSWIHIDDIVSAYIHLIDHPTANGVYNFCAPNPISNAEFMNSLGTALERPVWLPVPKIALEMILGEMSDLLLHGQFAVPARLQQEGFEFKYLTSEQALMDVYGKAF